MTPGGIRGRKLPQAWTPAAGMAHTVLQLHEISVLALLKTDIGAHPGRAGRKHVLKGRDCKANHLPRERKSLTRAHRLLAGPVP